MGPQVEQGACVGARDKGDVAGEFTDGLKRYSADGTWLEAVLIVVLDPKNR